jgi:hypothetical protein
MEIQLGHPTDLLAMLGGTLTGLYPGTHVGPPRKRGTASVVFRTRKPGILLSVDPGGIVYAHARAVLDTPVPGYPLAPPAPHFIVYEADDLELAPGLAPPRVGVFEGIPKNFPESTQTFDDLSSSSVEGHLSTPERELWRGRLEHIAGLLDDDDSLEALLVSHVDSLELAVDPGGRRAEVFAEMLRELAFSALGDRVRTASRESVEPLYIGSASDDESRRANRRVEVIVRRRAPGSSADDLRLEPAPEVAAGAVIGHVPGRCSVTVLDAAGRYHDPVDVVRRYDHEGRFRNAWQISWCSPAVSSGWVRVITPPGAGDDGVADPEEEPFFSFRRLLAADPADPEGGVPLLTEADHLDGVEAGDVVWFPEVGEVRCALTVRTPVTFLGQYPPEDFLDREDDAGEDDAAERPADLRPRFRPLATEPLPPDDPTGPPDPLDFDDDDVPPRAIAILELDDPDGIGVRLLGLRFARWSGGAVSVDGIEESELDRHDGARPDVQVSACYFEGNRTIGRTNGGALLLRDCGGVLVEECVFRGNHARHGGALFASSCRHVVVQGRPPRLSPDAGSGALDPVQAFEARRLGMMPPPTGGDLLGSSDVQSDGLHRNVTRTCFLSNEAWGAGGALAFVGTRFQVVDVWFVGNSARGIGGCVAASQSEPDVDPARGLARPGETWPRCDRNAIVRCVCHLNQAAAGGGVFALVGPTEDPTITAFGPSLTIDGARVLPGPLADGGFCRLEQNLILVSNSFDWSPGGIDVPLLSFGGGVLLAGGVYHLHGNRLHGSAAGCGGAVAALVGAQVFLEDNLIDHNFIPRAALPEPGAAVRGGGAIYAHGASGDVPTRVWLSGNQVRDNNRVGALSGAGVFDVPSEGDGGAVLAVCGAVIVCRAATGSTPNRFLSNTAAWNGGAIAARNAELAIGAGEVFDDNVAETGDGGALFVAGSRVGLGPAGADRYEASLEAMVTPPGGGRGARLLVEGAADEPVEFNANRAALEGGAISVHQQSSMPILPPTADSPRSTVVDRTVGLVRTVSIHHATFHRNSSDEELLTSEAGAPLAGSTIVFQDLDHGWRALYDDVTYRTAAGTEIDGAAERDRWIGPDPLGQVDLEDVRVELDQGVGILGIRSDGVDADGADISVTHLAGDPEESSWTRSAFVDIDRPDVP